jgi:hypothetical protein
MGGVQGLGRLCPGAEAPRFHGAAGEVCGAVGCLLDWGEQFSDSVREETTSTAADRSVRPTPELIKMATLLYTPSAPMLTFNSQIKTIENKRQELSR